MARGEARRFAEFVVQSMKKERYAREFVRRIQNSSNEWLANTTCEDWSADRLRFLKSKGGLAFAVNTFAEEFKEAKVGGDVDFYNSLEISKIWLDVKRNFIREASDAFMTQEEELLAQARYDNSIAEEHKICAYRDGEEFGLTEYGVERARHCGGGFTGCAGETTIHTEVINGLTISKPYCENCFAIKNGTKEIYEQA